VDPVNIALPLEAVQTTMLAGVRIVAFMTVAPPFSQKVVPGTVRWMIALGLAIAVAPRLTSGGTDTTGAFVGSLLLQAVIGALFGFLVMMVFSAIQSAGAFIDMFGGFQMAAAFDPMSMTSGAQFQRLYQMTALVLLFVTDGYQIVLRGLVRTFDALPLGAALDPDLFMHSLTTGVSQMFLGALQIAGPLLVVLFLADVGLGLLTRVAPALNAFAMGFPLKILISLSLGAFAFLALPNVVRGLTGKSLSVMLGAGS
jgi:flagellar biosynthetic protein FliR